MGFFNLKDRLGMPKNTAAVSASDAHEIETAKDYVSAMTQSLKSTSEQQSMAMQRVSHLSKSLFKMERKLVKLRRVEAENNELSGRTSKLENELSHKSEEARDLDCELSIVKRQLKTAQEELLSLRSETTLLKDRGGETAARLGAQKNEVSGLKNRTETLERRQKELSGQNRALEQDLSKAQGEVSLHRRSAAEFIKKFEELETSTAALRGSYDAALVDFNALKLSYNELNDKYIEAQARLNTAEFEANAAQSQYADSLRRREEESLSLKNRIEHFEAQMRIKDSAKVQAEREITELQHGLRLANMRAEQTDSLSREIAREAEASASNVISSQSDYDALNAKFMSALDDIDTLKKLSQIQKSKLMQYAALDSAPVLGLDVAAVKTPNKPAAQNDANVEPAKNIRILRQLKPAS